MIDTEDSDTPVVPGVEILYEQGPCLIVNKPAGLLTQAPPGIDSMELRIKRFLIRREQKPGNCYLGVPHRLDRPASGVMVFAKHVRAAKRISEQFHDRSVKKTYWACVEGHVEEDEGTWEDSMRKIPDMARSEIVGPTHPHARGAVLHFRVAERADWGTRLEIELETGQTHQIRLQASSRGHPLLGDALYGSTVPFGEQFEDQRLRAIGLHARTLSLRHPMTKEPISITAPVGPAWRTLGIGE